MNNKSKFTLQLMIGIVLIAAVIVFSFKFLLKGPPLVKVMAIGLILVVTIGVVNKLKKINRK